MSEKVAFIITSINQGGLETYLLRFLTHINGKISSVVVCNKRKFDREFLQRFEEINVEVVFLPVNLSPFSVFRFYRFLANEGITSVCDFRGDFSGLSLMISWAARIKNRIVFYRESAHQFEPTILKKVYISLSNYLILRFSTKILSNSLASLRNFFGSNKLTNKYNRVLKNGVYDAREVTSKIDIRGLYGIPSDAYLIGHVGRFTPAKNHKLIIKLAKKLCSSDSSCYFLLCGAEVRMNIQQELERHNLKKRIIAPGLCKDINAHLGALDLFVFPSHNEGQSNALIEAMNSGVLTVASNIPSILETVPSEMRNFLHDPDSVDDFVSQIENIKNNGLRYDTDRVKNWSRSTYDQRKCFGNFLNEIKEY